MPLVEFDDSTIEHVFSVFNASFTSGTRRVQASPVGEMSWFTVELIRWSTSLGPFCTFDNAFLQLVADII